MGTPDTRALLSGWTLMQGEYHHVRSAVPSRFTVHTDGRLTTAVAEGIESEFPGVEPSRVGLRHDELLCVIRSAGRAADLPGWDRVARLSVEAGVTQSFDYGSDFMVEEHVHAAADWVVGTALDLRNRQTVLSVFERQALSAGPIAQARLPARPLGLHGTFVPA